MREREERIEGEDFGRVVDLGLKKGFVGILEIRDFSIVLLVCFFFSRNIGIFFLV